MSTDAILNRSEPNWTKLNRTANVFGLSKSRLKSTWCVNCGLFSELLTKLQLIQTCSFCRVRPHCWLWSVRVMPGFQPYASVHPFKKNRVLFLPFLLCYQAWSSAHPEARETRRPGNWASRAIYISTRPFGTIVGPNFYCTEKREMVSIVYLSVMRTRRGNGYVNGYGWTEM